MLSAAGLVEAFGHVSARTPDGGLLITPTTPLRWVNPAEVVELDADGSVVGPLDAPVPLEAPLHAAIYRARPDVSAICRGHGTAIATWATGTAELPLLHGLGALCGSTVPVHPERTLVSTAAAGDRAAASLAGNQALLLLANGGLAVGEDLLTAATRLWFLEERSRIALAAPPGAGPSESEPNPWSERLADTLVELARARAWFEAAFGPSSVPRPAMSVPGSTT